MLKKWYKNRSIRRAKDFVNANYKFIDVKWWELLLNYHCHYNSYHFAKTKGYWIVGCYAWSWSGWVAHFINKTKKGVYIDNTVGETNLCTKYLLVNEYDTDDFCPSSDLSALKKNIFMQWYNNDFLNWWYGFNAEDLF